MFYQIFLSPQVKRWVIVTYKHGIYELPNELRHIIFGNIRKVSKPHRMIAQCTAPRQNKNSASTSKRAPKHSDQTLPPPPHPKTRASPKYPATDCRPPPEMTPDESSRNTPPAAADTWDPRRDHCWIAETLLRHGRKCFQPVKLQYSLN